MPLYTGWSSKCLFVKLLALTIENPQLLQHAESNHQETIGIAIGLIRDNLQAALEKEVTAFWDIV